MNVVQVSNLCKQYDSFSLKNVSFGIQSGRIVGFIGRNGAGKTTTIKAMLNLIHPSGGEVTYFGLPFDKNERTIKEKIGYSAGAVNYYPKKKLKDIVAVTKTFYSDWNEQAYAEYKSLFGLDENKSPDEMSEGMRVKCTLLIALSHNAKVLILDEPTSGLDPFSRDELLDVFTCLKNRGVAILFSTHIVSDIEKCADDVICIKNGEILLATDMERFRSEYINDGETVEQAVIRLERGEVGV